MFENHTFRGYLTLQAHTQQDVFARVPVGSAGAGQTDELEMGLVPPPDLTGVAPADVAAVTEAHYAARCADYALSRGNLALLTNQPAYLTLNIDVRLFKRIRALYQDQAGLDSFVPPQTIEEADRRLASVAGLHKNTERDKAYVVTLYLQFDDLL